MEQMPIFLSYSLSAIIYFKYVLVFLGTIIEGPIVMIAAGFLLNLGAFDFIPLFTALVLGDLLGDVIWYYIGYHFSATFINKFGRFFGLTPEIFEKVKIIFHKHHSRILFYSKFVMGFGLAIYILMVAGASRVNFAKYMLLNTIGEFFFVGMLMFLGFHFGRFYHYLSSGFKAGFLVGLAILLILFIHNFQKYIRNKTLKSL